MSRGQRRFYIDEFFSGSDTCLQLSPQETFHLNRVLRLKAGDVCQVFNREGWGAEAVIERVSLREGARLRLERTFPLRKGSVGVYLKVGQALPQKRKMDDLVEKAEELGVQELWVLESKRSMVRMRPEAKERARERWQRIVTQAAKQSGNAVLTRLEGPLSFEKVVEKEIRPPEKAFLFHPDPEGLRFSDLMEELRNSPSRGSPSSFFLFFGPEGGFSPEEVRLAESRGVRKVYLGSSTLRIETAFVGVLSAFRWMAQ